MPITSNRAATSQASPTTQTSKPPSQTNPPKVESSKKPIQLSQEAKSLAQGPSAGALNFVSAFTGTAGDDKISPEVNGPVNVNTGAGNDQVWRRGSGDSDIKTGPGNDLVGLSRNMFHSGNHNAAIDGGEGNDAVFVGDDTRSNQAFKVTDEQGRTVAQNGEGGDQVKLKNVESVHAKNYVSGSKGDDQIKADLKTGDSDVRVNETHTIFGHDGNDQISVKTGDNGFNETKIWPGEGNNQVRFEGGAGGDRVSYISEKDKTGSDQVQLNGGEGHDALSITSPNYSLFDGQGELLSKGGNGADKISVEGFEDIWLNGKQFER